MFDYIANCCRKRDLAWDCATGNGQAARSLVPYFTSVIATDASDAQIASAGFQAGIEFRVARAEASSLPSESVDLITVAQALHWFDIDRFFAEAFRVLKTGGLLAVWCYEHCRVDSACDDQIRKILAEVERYWPPERRLVESRYVGIELPVKEFSAECFNMQANWGAENMLDYIRTWSASQRYMIDNHVDPTAEYADKLRAIWSNERRTVRWPITLRTGRK